MVNGSVKHVVFGTTEFIGTLRPAYNLLSSDTPSVTIGVWILFTGQPSYQEVEPMVMYVFWESDMLFYVKRCQDIIKRGSYCRWCIQMDIKITNNGKLWVHGCHIYHEIHEYFEGINCVEWMAINTNKISREARIWYVNTYRHKAGIMRKRF